MEWRYLLCRNLIMIDKKKPHYIGHRKRLQQKFLKSSSSVADYELLELILFWSIPRKDIKPLAKQLLNQFGSLNNIINTNPEKILNIIAVNKNVANNFAVLRELIRRILQNKVIKENVISSWNALVDYLKVSMGNMNIEQFRILFLNKKNILLADELQSSGTVDQTSVYPREIVKRVLFYEATAIILVHNHPSGDPTPSKSDIDLTKQIADACAVINVIIHDHVIISSTKFYSFKSNLLL